ncbi:VOC family protein [Burkholderia cenocepacia]|uniref:VOC family protein n=1 Tax=Burkholderia cenocepacia TaxID=95486 RepID=UPI00264C6E39|nr:VOC family protein [Burkholderia cenocepacia]MDN7681581.1 VOC family protein [Burkholderia cenocepacia]
MQDIAFVRYQVTDLDRMENFLLDFGLHRAARSESALYMRAAGTAHHVHVSELGADNATTGFGLHAREAADLERLAAHLGVAVEDNPEPGGGRRVRFRDPDGFLVDVVHGAARHAALPQREPVAVNFGGPRQRLGKTVRLKPRPSAVLRLGHVALQVRDFPAMLAFYRDVLGFRISDTYWAGTEHNTIAAFLHCGLGEQWTDHHTIALISAQDGRARFDHTAFEVLDLDDVVLGGEHLKACGYRHSWGVGRHVQGSQIFDYWRDPFGNKIEHWTDGDLVNDSTPAGHGPLSLDELSQWAPPLAPEFFS